MSSSEQVKMTTPQMLRDLGCYEYVSEKGDVIRLRQLAENEREPFVEDLTWLLEQLQKAIDQADQDLFYKAHIKFIRLIQKLAVSPEKVKFIQKWNVRARINDIYKCLGRIGQVERCLKTGEEVPEQESDQELMSEDQAQTAPVSKLEQQGESLPAGASTQTM